MVVFRVVKSESLYFRVGDVVRIVSDAKGGEITVQSANSNGPVELFKVLAGVTESSTIDAISNRVITEIDYPIVFSIEPTEVVGNLKLFILGNDSIVFDLRSPRMPGDGGSKSGSGGGFLN